MSSVVGEGKSVPPANSVSRATGEPRVTCELPIHPIPLGMSWSHLDCRPRFWSPLLYWHPSWSGCILLAHCCKAGGLVPPGEQAESSKARAFADEPLEITNTWQIMSRELGFRLVAVWDYTGTEESMRFVEPVFMSTCLVLLASVQKPVRAGSREAPPFQNNYVHKLTVTQHAAVLWLDNKPQAKCTILSYL
jgi:hypothetical protein